jgi:hypothetical protein
VKSRLHRSPRVDSMKCIRIVGQGVPIRVINEDAHYAYRPLPHRRSYIRIPAWIVIVAALLLIFFVSAHADELVQCVGPGVTCIWRDKIGDPYVLRVPPPQTAEEQEAADEREAAWVARCHPTTAPDKFGVERYRYSAPGCEFGR